MASKVLKMTFKDSQNKAKTISLDQVKDSYNEGEVKNAMDEIIKSQILSTDNGPVDKKSKAYLQTVEKENIAL